MPERYNPTYRIVVTPVWTAFSQRGASPSSPVKRGGVAPAGPPGPAARWLLFSGRPRPAAFRGLGVAPERNVVPVTVSRGVLAPPFPAAGNPSAGGGP